MPKVLLLPSYLGGGFGHIGRVLALGDALKERGWIAAYALGGYHAQRIEAAGSLVFRLRRPYEPRRDSLDGPAFTVFSDLGYQLLRDGLHRSSAVWSALSEQVGVIRNWKPDLLVSDSWLLAGVLSGLMGIPVIQIVRTATHPSGSGLIWWQEPPAGLIPPDPAPVFNPILEQLGMPPVEKAAELLRGSLYLVPSIPDLDPLPQGLPDTFYTGPLVRRRVDDQAPHPSLVNLEADLPLVYVTLGGGAGPVGGPLFYRTLYKALADLPVHVIASTGARFSPQELPAPPSNFHLEPWVPGPEVIECSRLVVYPGGYGTTMELVQAGVPGLVIPFHSEQESNGRRLEAAGAGRVLLPVAGEPRRIEGPWHGGEYAFFVYPTSSLTPEEIRLSVLELIDNPQYQQQAQVLKSRSDYYGGASQAAKLIEEYFSAEPPVLQKGWDRLPWWQKLSLSAHL